MIYVVKRIGKFAAWLSLTIVILICFDVIFRYLFNATQIWMIELEWYLFALLIILSGAWTWSEDRHVRVDVLYSKYSVRTKKWINRFGHIFLALPWILVVVYASLHYAGYSWRWNEGSPDPGGLPARYLIKYAISLGFILMLFTAIRLLATTDNPNQSS